MAGVRRASTTLESPLRGVFRVGGELQKNTARICWLWTVDGAGRAGWDLRRTQVRMQMGCARKCRECETNERDWSRTSAAVLDVAFLSQGGGSFERVSGGLILLGDKHNKQEHEAGDSCNSTETRHKLSCPKSH